MEIKDKLVLNGMTLASADQIENNTICEFQTSEGNTPGYYIVQWTGIAYNLQVKYTCHTFYPPVIIPEGELVFPDKFWTSMSKSSYWYHQPDEAIPVMVKLKQVVIPYIELIPDKNTTNKLPSHFK